MARIMAVSSGWTTFTCPRGTTLPSATATMSIWDSDAQAIAPAMMPQSSAALKRKVGENGVSMTSRAAGRNSRSSDVRRAGFAGNVMTLSRGFCAVVDAPPAGLVRSAPRNGVGSTITSLSPYRLANEVGVKAVMVHQRLVGAYLGKLAALHHRDAVSVADR